MAYRSSSSSSVSIPTLLEKMQNVDKDFRYMGIMDLMAQLEKKSFHLDERMETKVVKMLIQLLSDTNGEVQNLAVKCVAPLVAKVNTALVREMIVHLVGRALRDDEKERDVSSMGLRSVIESSSPNSPAAGEICASTTTPLLNALGTATTADPVMLEALELLTEILHCFGKHLSLQHSTILQIVLPLLKHTRAAVRKRAISTLGELVASLTDALFDQLVQALIANLSATPTHAERRNIIQCISTISRETSARLGPYLKNLVPLIITTAEIEEEDELRESCIQVWEGLVTRCTSDFDPYFDHVVKMSLEFVQHDPNYHYDSEDEDDDDVDDDGDGDDDDFGDDDDDQYSDDEDMSWKVRRSAAKFLAAAIKTHPGRLQEFHTHVAPVIAARFKEREENVRVDVIGVYVELLRQTQQATGFVIEGAMDEDNACATHLQALLPTIIKSASKHLKDKSIKTRQCVLNLLTELVSAIPGGLGDHINALLPGLENSFTEKNANTNVKLDTLAFLCRFVQTNSSTVVLQAVEHLVKILQAGIGDKFYKVTAEALSVCTHFVATAGFCSDSLSPAHQQAIRTLYPATLQKLQANDIDQEVKERSILCMAEMLAHAADDMPDALKTCLPIFLARLQNEITRITSAKALVTIAASPLRLNLTPILSDAIKALSSFLRKNNRALRIAALQTLDVLIRCSDERMQTDLCELLSRTSTQNSTIDTQESKRRRVIKKGPSESFIEPALYNVVLAELPPLIDASDLHAAQLSIRIVTAMITSSNALAPKLSEGSPSVMSSILKLTVSPLVQRGALEALLMFLRILVQHELPGFSYDEILATLQEQVVQSSMEAEKSEAAAAAAAAASAASAADAAPAAAGVGTLPIPRQAFATLSKCVAAITIPEAKHVRQLTAQLTADVASPTSSDANKLLALMSLGEIGRVSDLAALPDLTKVVIDAFGSPSEDVKAAAAFCLGNLAVGNLDAFLPTVLKEIESVPSRQYLLLQALKEIISNTSKTDKGVEALAPALEEIWTLLINHCGSEEEGTRNVVAECLGKLTLVNPQALVPKLQEKLGSESHFIRGTVITAFKFTVSGQVSKVDFVLKQAAPTFFAAIDDPDVDVRRLALVAFNSAAHNKPAVVIDSLPDFLPRLYRECVVREELKRTVEMGPFKHEVDDGLDTRKSAFECMYTLSEACADRVDIDNYIQHLRLGLKDHYDIQMLSYLMLTRLQATRPDAVLNHMNMLCEALKDTIMKKAKKGVVQQEIDKLEELKKSALRAVSSLTKIEGSENSLMMQELLAAVRADPVLRPRLEEAGDLAEASTHMDVEA